MSKPLYIVQEKFSDETFEYIRAFDETCTDYTKRRDDALQFTPEDVLALLKSAQDGEIYLITPCLVSAKKT
jgi:hypothetical protein